MSNISYDPSISVDLGIEQKTGIATLTSGSTTVIAGVTDETIKVYSVTLVPYERTILRLTDGTDVIARYSVMGNETLHIDYGDKPLVLPVSTGLDFNVQYLTQLVEYNIQYTQG